MRLSPQLHGESGIPEMPPDARFRHQFVNQILSGGSSQGWRKDECFPLANVVSSFCPTSFCSQGLNKKMWDKKMERELKLPP
jgi:hypothetical protein